MNAGGVYIRSECRKVYSRKWGENLMGRSANRSRLEMLGIVRN